MRAQPRPLSLAVVFTLCAVASLPGASSSSSNAHAVYRSGVELVALNVVVTDAHKKLVDGLAEQDFVVLEDGVRQPIAYFAGGRVPLDLVLLVDASASMAVVRREVQRAASNLVAALRPGDRAAVVAFDTSMDVLEPLTTDLAKVRSAVAHVGSTGDTALFTSLYVALREFAGPIRQVGEVRRLAFVVVTDGEENRSSVSLDALLDEARSRGVAVYAVMMQGEEARLRERREGRPRPGPAGVRQLAVETGAAAYFPLRARELPAIASAIADELSHQYSLAYVPAPLAGKTPLRSVAVQLSGRPGLHVRTRTTYRADATAASLMASR